MKKPPRRPPPPKSKGRPKGKGKRAELKLVRGDFKRKQAPKGFDLGDLPPAPPVEFKDKRAVFTDVHWTIVEEMARYGCSSGVIANYLGIGRRTLYAAHLKDEYLQRKGKAWSASKYAILKRQYEHAQANIVGSIWWGKQHLKQADKKELSGLTGSPLFEAGLPKLEAILEKLARARGGGAVTPPGEDQANPPAAPGGVAAPEGVAPATTPPPTVGALPTPPPPEPPPPQGTA